MRKKGVFVHRMNKVKVTECGRGCQRQREEEDRQTDRGRREKERKRELGERD